MIGPPLVTHGSRPYQELSVERALHDAEGGGKQLTENTLVLEEVEAEEVL